MSWIIAIIVLISLGLGVFILSALIAYPIALFFNRVLIPMILRTKKQEKESVRESTIFSVLLLIILVLIGRVLYYGYSGGPGTVVGKEQDCRDVLVIPGGPHVSDTTPYKETVCNSVLLIRDRRGNIQRFEPNAPWDDTASVQSGDHWPPSFASKIRYTWRQLIDR